MTVTEKDFYLNLTDTSTGITVSMHGYIAMCY